jgi:GNAT superfamily N-acetyltransferase
VSDELLIEPIDARPWSNEELDGLFADGFPAWITADQEVKRWIGRVRESFADLELVVADGDALVAAGWGVPIQWDGRAETLPGGYTATLAQSIEQLDAGMEPNTFVIMAMVVHPQHRGAGIAGVMLEGMCELAQSRGWENVVAPVRPTRKSECPEMDIAAYAAMTREDERPSDPWIRTHVRAGARIVATCEQSQRMTGTIDDWRDWTGMALDASGRHRIPDGLSLLAVDLDQDTGHYAEPGVWVQHRPVQMS